MAYSKKTLTWIFAIAAFAVILLLIYVFRCKLFNLASCVQDPNKTNTPVPAGSPTTKWVAESFPLNIGMFGPQIKVLQTALHINDDGKFGQQTKASIIATGYTVPLSQNDYNTIISGLNTMQQIPGIYAKYDNTIIRNKDLSQARIAKADEWLGTVTGVDDSNTYYEIDGTYYVIKTSSYIVSK